MPNHRGLGTDIDIPSASRDSDKFSSEVPFSHTIHPFREDIQQNLQDNFGDFDRTATGTTKRTGEGIDGATNIIPIRAHSLEIIKGSALYISIVKSLSSSLLMWKHARTPQTSLTIQLILPEWFS